MEGLQCALLNRASQEVAEGDTEDTDSVFQDVYAFFGIEGPHFFQCFQPWGHVKIVVVAKPVGKGPDPLRPEELFAGLPFLQ